MTANFVSLARIAELQADDPSLTSKMIRAGLAAMLAYEGDDAGEIAAVWKAMSACAPVLLASVLAENKRLAEESRQCHAWNDELVRRQYALSKRLDERDASLLRATGKRR